MDSNDTDSPGTPDTSRTRKRKRETPEERRVKCRLRKRRKRADLPPLARRVQANSSSSSGEGFAAEIERNPGGRIYLFNEAAHNRLQEQVVAAGRPLHIQRREFTSALPQEVSGSNPDSDGDVDGQGCMVVRSARSFLWNRVLPESRNREHYTWRPGAKNSWPFRSMLLIA